jgi:TonB-linked SusC/RagA family outer membrane protein
MKKWYALILLVGCMHWGFCANGQTVSIVVKNAPVEDVFRMIEKQTGFFFTYTKEQLADAKPVTIEAKDRPLKEVLDACFRNQPIAYEILDRVIVVKRIPGTTAIPPSVTKADMLRVIVVDFSDDKPLEGATVVIQSTRQAGISDEKGMVTLYDVTSDMLLEVSFVGFVSREIPLTNLSANLVVKLSREETKLETVIVNTGLYKRPVGSFTGASNSVSGEDIKVANPVNVIRALTALDPSLRIAENNALGSDPNALPMIQLRGQNNLPITAQGGTNNAISTPVSNGDIMSGYLANPNEPLIILDGFQTTLQSLVDMDINRIDKVTILKDAAATVAYGSRAANGVIVVETKRPVPGKPQVTYATNLQLQTPELSSYQLMDANGILEAQRLAGIYTDLANNANNIALNQWYDYRLYQAQSGVNTDWLAQPLQNGLGMNNSLNLSGGNKGFRFSMNLGLNNATGVLKGSGRRAYSLAAYFGYATRNFRISNNMLMAYNKASNSSWGNYAAYGQQFPFFKLYDSLGNVPGILEPSAAQLGIPITAPGGVFTNAMYDASLGVKDFSTYKQFTNTTLLEWSINNNFRVNGALHYYNQVPASEYYLPAEHSIFSVSGTTGFSDQGLYNQTRGRNSMLEGRLSVDYTKKTADHLLLISAGTSLQQTSSSATSIQVTGIPNNYLAQLGLANGYGNNLKPFTGNSATHSFSWYGSVSYSYRERYTIEATANASGSSQFGANNRVAPFWAAGAGWNLHKMGFINNASFINKLRLQATYGITGNQNFAAYLAQPVYEYNLQYNYRMQLGANVQAYSNPDLKWQQTKKTNLGIITSLFKELINLRFDFFIENTNNLILPIGVAPSTGFISYEDNLGATQNKGFEWMLSMPVIRNHAKNFYWTFTLNGSHYTNTIKSLSPAIDAINKANDATNGSVDQKAPQPRFVVGESMTRIWAVPSLGIDPATGNELFLKQDGSTSFVWDPADKRPVGDASSKLKGVIGNTVSYKGFTFNLLLGYEWGGQLYNQTLVDKIENVDLRISNADQRVLDDRWKQPGDQAKFKAISSVGNATYATSRFVQDNNYLEASSITIGYIFPKQAKWVQALRLSSPRVYFTQNALFRISTVELERGTAYPFARSFNFGLATGF